MILICIHSLKYIKFDLNVSGNTITYLDCVAVLYTLKLFKSDLFIYVYSETPSVDRERQADPAVGTRKYNNMSL